MIDKKYQVVTKGDLKRIFEVIDKWDDYFRTYYYEAGLYYSYDVRQDCYEEINGEIIKVLRKDIEYGKLAFNGALDEVDYFTHYAVFRQAFSEEKCRTYSDEIESYERFYGSALQRVKDDLDIAYYIYIKKFYEDFEL